MFQVDVLEQDAFEVLRLIRSLKNGFAPINRIPPEVLTLIPDSWDRPSSDKHVIALTHVCQAWRDIFISHSSLWAQFDCNNADKTRVYLERSKSSPIALHLQRMFDSYPRDPLFQTIPHIIGRLESLHIQAPPGYLQDITAHLTDPAPLLKHLTIDATRLPEPRHNHILTLALFNGDLSSLHVLYLHCVPTDLPWRNMVNLTSLTLDHAPPGSTSKLLDFFESTSRISRVVLHCSPLTSDGQDRRLVSLKCLKSLSIYGDQPTSLLLDHLLVPVGTDLQTWLRSPCPRVEDHLPRSLNNLGNFLNFTQLRLRLSKRYSVVQFTGPNGGVCMTSVSSGDSTTGLVLEFLARLDTSTVKRLEIIYRDPFSGDLIFPALLPMKNLCTLTISRCKNLRSLICALDPDKNSSNPPICPKLEELVLRTGWVDVFEVESMVGMAAARASRGAKLKSVRVLNLGEFELVDMSDLCNHVLDVEHGFEDGELDDEYITESDEED